MSVKKTIRQLRLKSDDDQEDVGEKNKIVSSDFGGRKAIIILFVFTVAVSFIFWMKSNFLIWFREFMGPSTWTFSR